MPIDLSSSIIIRDREKEFGNSIKTGRLPLSRNNSLHQTNDLFHLHQLWFHHLSNALEFVDECYPRILDYDVVADRKPIHKQSFE